MLVWVYLALLLIAAYCFKEGALRGRRPVIMYMIAAVTLVPFTFGSFNIVVVSQGSKVIVTMPEMFLFGLGALLLNAAFAILEFTEWLPDLRETEAEEYQAIGDKGPSPGD